MTAKQKSRVTKAVQKTPSTGDPDLGSQVTFKGTLRSSQDEEIEGQQLQVEIYSLKADQWLTLTPVFTVKGGRFKYTCPLNGRSKNPADELVSGGMILGLVPMFRLVKVPPESPEWAEVIGHGGMVDFDAPELALTVDFGSKWLLPPPLIKHHLSGEQPKQEFSWAAVPRPRGNQTLYAGMAAAIAHPEWFKDFDKETDQILVVPQGVGVPQGGDPIPLVKTLNQQIALQQSQLDTLVVNLQAKDRAFEYQTLEFNEAKQSLSRNAEALKEKEEQVAAAGVKAAPARAVLANIAEEVSAAQSQLAGGSIALTNVSMNLKAFVKPGKEGVDLQLIDTLGATVAKPEVVSSLNLNFEEQAIEGPTDNGGLVPRVLGLTETAARKRLLAYGYRLKAIYQLALNKPSGQAFRQVPEAGEELPTGSTLTVVFAKPNTV